LRAATGAFLAAIIFLAGVLVGRGAPSGGGIAVLEPLQLGAPGGGAGTQMARGARAPDTVSAGTAEPKPTIRKVGRVVEYSGLGWTPSIPKAAKDPAVLNAAVFDPRERRISKERHRHDDRRRMSRNSEFNVPDQPRRSRLRALPDAPETSRDQETRPFGRLVPGGKAGLWKKSLYRPPKPGGEK
jgi:hypothetical protein